MDNQQAFQHAMDRNLDAWVPACGGLEQPTMIRGRKVLYCYNPAQGRHAHIDLGSDIEVSHEELFS